jgi:DNA-binding YbaB/EbfC family protein
MKARLPQGYGGGQKQQLQSMLAGAQKLQEDMAAKEKELDETEYSVSTGGGSVEIIAFGNHQVKSVRIKPEAVDPEDVEMLEDLIAAAVSELMRKIDAHREQETSALQNGLSGLSGGLNIPGLF